MIPVERVVVFHTKLHIAVGIFTCRLKAEPDLSVISISGIPVPWSQETQLGLLEIQLGFPAAERFGRKFKCWLHAFKLTTPFNNISD